MYDNGDDWCALILAESTEQSGMPWTSRMYVCISVCLTLVVLFGFDSVRGHNLTLIPCQNILPWRWWVCIYVGWIRGTILSVPDEQSVRLHVGVLVFKGVIQGTVIILSPYSLSKCTPMIMASGYLRWDDFVGSGPKACTCSTLKLLLRLDPSWGDNFTLIPRHNILRWRWLVCIYLGWIDGTTPLDLDKQAVRSSPVCLALVV